MSLEVEKMKRVILLVFLVAIMALSLAGCKSQDIIDETGKKVGEMKVEDGTTTVTIDLTENVAEGEPCEYDGQCGSYSDLIACKNKQCVPIECRFVSDCDASADICFQGKCMTEAELFERFDQWQLNMMCQGTCDNCASGNLKSTMSSGRDDMEYRICTDCMDDNDCKDGFWCDYGKCVPG